MSPSVTVLTGIVLLVLAISKGTYDLLVEPWVFQKSKKKYPKQLDKWLDDRRWRNNVSATIFLVVTSAFSIWNIQGAIMSGEVAKSEFDALSARVKKLEDDHPPGSAQQISERLLKIEASVEKVTRSAATLDDLERTKEELEITIEKVVAELKRLRKLLEESLGQRG